MIITEKLYLHYVGDILVISDAACPPNMRQLHPRAFLMADDRPATAARLRRWLIRHELDEIAEAMKISRSAAHRLRKAMDISPRGSYEK